MINWYEQWQRFAPGFKEGKLSIDLRKYCSKETSLKQNVIHLIPGPGFGDFSHPTTKLMLKQLALVVSDKAVLDIGSGSGILSLASSAFGATSVLGLDIDKEVILHAKENALLNHFKNVDFQLSTPLYPSFQEGVILMNMITSEQAQAVAMLPKLREVTGHFIISGLLSAQEAQVIDTYSSWNWVPITLKRSQGWSLIYFKK